MSEAAAATASGLQAPGLPRRMACLVYEGLLLFGIGLIPGALGALLTALTHQPHSLQNGGTLRLIAFLIYAAYFSWFWSQRGQTLPMQTWHIRVVTADGKHLTPGHALLRFIASCLWVAPAAVLAAINHWTGWEALGAVAVGMVGYALLALLHPQRQFWHDAICGTRLITAPAEARHLA